VGGENALHEREAFGRRGARIAVKSAARRHDGAVYILAASHRYDAGNFLGRGIDDLQFLGLDRVDPSTIDIELPIVISHCQAPSIAVTSRPIFYPLAGPCAGRLRRPRIVSGRRLSLRTGAAGMISHEFYGPGSHFGPSIIARLPLHENN